VVGYLKEKNIYAAGFREALFYPKRLRLSFLYLLNMCIKNE